VRVNEDDDVKVVILRSEGKAFSAGHEFGRQNYRTVTEVGLENKKARTSLTAQLRHTNDYVYGPKSYVKCAAECLKATIAEVKGYAYAGACLLVESCDIVIAAPDALFGSPAGRYFGSGFHYAQWVHVIGLKKVKWLSLMATPWTAAEAQEIGFVHQIVEKPELAKTTESYAEQIAKMPLDRIIAIKHWLNTTQEIMQSSAIRQTSSCTAQTGVMSRYAPDETQFWQIMESEGVAAAVQAASSSQGVKFTDK
jgi:enoyl-CoA hydratase